MNLSTNLDPTSLAEKDFAFFYRVIMRGKMGAMHQTIIDAVMHDKKNLVVMAARGHFKTTILSKAFPLWICFRTPEDNPQIVLIQSASLEQSTEILRDIKKLVSSNTFLSERLLPDNIHQVKWSETQLEFRNGHRIICRPFADSIRGLHVNYSICDDVLKDETTNVEEAKKVFYAVIFPITQAKGGKHIVVGTPMSYSDLLFDLSKRDSFKSLEFPALLPDGSPQFPEHFTAEKLAMIRDTMPRHLWSREYLIKPVSEESALFPYETLLKPCIDLELKPLAEDEETASSYVLGGDVAVSEKERADFSCYTLIKISPDRPWRYFKKFLFKGMGTGEQGEFVAGLMKQYNVVKMVVEQTGLSFGVVDFLLHDDRTKFTVEGFNTTQKSKAEILGLLETTLRNRHLKLENDGSLLDELAGWEIVTKEGKQVPRSVKEHDDQVMSLALAVFAASQVSSAIGAVGVDKPVSALERKELNRLDAVDVFGVDRRSEVIIPIDSGLPRPDEVTWVG